MKVFGPTRREHISREIFTVKFPLCRKRKWDRSYYDRHARCLRCMLHGGTFCLIYRHTRVLISTLFNAVLPVYLSFSLLLSPLSPSIFIFFYFSPLLPFFFILRIFFLATRVSYLSLALSSKERNLRTFNCEYASGKIPLPRSDSSISV